MQREEQARSPTKSEWDSAVLGGLVWSEEMARDGYVFYLSENGVWFTENVPVKYLEKTWQDDA